MRLGFCITHYGAEYFRAALEAIAPQVDKIVILYTDMPSQGFMPETAMLPDTEASLIHCTDIVADKIRWIHGRWPNEGAHVDAILQFAAGYDWLVRFDTDEIFPDGFVDEMIAQADKDMEDHEPWQDHAKNYRVPFVHHWKAFDKVCRDGQMPVRLTRTSGGVGEKYLDAKGKWWVHHMGYAQDTKYINYKLQVSGHRPEFRPEWYAEKWMANAQEDLHPVCKYGFWNAEPYDKTTLPAVLLKHPNYNKDVIG